MGTSEFIEMVEYRVRQLFTTIGIIYLSGECFSKSLISDDLHPILTTAATETVSTSSPQTTTILLPHENDTTVNSTSSTVKTTQPTESTENVDFAGNVTANMDGLFDGNGTLNPKKLALDRKESDDLNLRETAGFVAIGFLGFSVLGYVGFVLWRRYLQNKYGNSQTLITEVYDISDLRHFEI